MSYRTVGIILARDEAARITPAIQSLIPWVDEVWVWDTGSIDGTLALAQQAGARVVCASWPDSFAEARNAALVAADADWVVMLDADERVVEGGAFLAGLRQRAPDECYSVLIESPFGEAANRQVSLTRTTRVMPGSSRYVGCVHEQLRSHLDLHPAPVRFWHEGYLPEAMRRKCGRNRALLNRALTDRPADPYLHYQIGKEDELQCHFELAAQSYLRSATYGGLGEAYAHDLVVRNVYCLAQSQDWPALCAWIKQQGERWTASPDWWFVRGNAALDEAVAKPAQAAELLAKAEVAWRKCLLIGEQEHHCGAVRGRGSFLAAHNLRVLLEGQGRELEPDATIRPASVGTQVSTQVSTPVSTSVSASESASPPFGLVS